MTHFFYLLAGLPELYLDKAPPISHDQFMILCGQWLKKPQQELLDLCRYESFFFVQEENLPSALAKWMDFEHSLRLFLARSRAEETDEEISSITMGMTDSGAIVAGNKVLQQENPLKRAQLLMGVRWRFLSGLLEEKLFGLDAVCIYSLKLQLLENAALWDEEAGLKVLSGILENTDTGEYGQQN